MEDLPIIFKLPSPAIPVRIESVEFDDGRIYVYTSADTLEYPYEPAILIHPAVVPYLSDVPRGRMYPYAYEVRAPLDVLVGLFREASELTGAVLFIEPERQFLLDRRISLGTEILDGMPSLSLPLFGSWRGALSFILRSSHGPVARVFLENIYYLHRVAVDVGRVDSVKLPSEALRVVLDMNIDPTTVNAPSGILLPASRVRVSVNLPFAFTTTDPLLSKRKGPQITVSNGSAIPLADAEILGLDYKLVLPLYSSTSPGLLQMELARLFELFERFLRRVQPSPGKIDEIARRTSSERVISAYAYLEAVSRVVLSLPSFLASTNVLTPLGRLNYLTGWNLLRRDPKAYKRLYADNPICSRALNGLESFLLALSSLPLELPRWLRGSSS